MLVAPSFLLLLLSSTSPLHRGISIPLSHQLFYPALIALYAGTLLLHMRTSRFDLPAVLLLPRILLLLLPLLYTRDLDGYAGNYLAVLISPLAYLVASNSDSKGTERPLARLVILAGAIVVVQLSLVTSRTFSAGYSSYYSKMLIDIPIGRSNSIASYLLMVFFFLLSHLDGGFWKSVVMTLILAGIAMTLSSGAIGALGLAAFLWFLTPPRARTAKRRSPVAALLLVALAVLVVAYLDRTSSGEVTGAFDRLTAVFGARPDELDVITNGRISVLRVGMDRFRRHPILGNGLGFSFVSADLLDRMRPHNLFVEALAQGGIVNLILVAGAIGVALRKVARNSRDRVCASILWAAVALLCHGMVEPTLFSFAMDLFFWSLVGLGVARANLLERMSLAGDETIAP